MVVSDTWYPMGLLSESANSSVPWRLEPPSLRSPQLQFRLNGTNQGGKKNQTGWRLRHQKNIFNDRAHECRLDWELR